MGHCRIDFSVLKLNSNISLQEQWTDLFLVIMFGVFPLWTGFMGYSEITFAKYVFFRGFSSIYIVGLLIISIKMLIYDPKDNTEIEKLYRGLTVSQKFILIYLAASLISTVFSEYTYIVWIGNRRFEGFVTQLLYVGVFWGVASYGKLKRKHLFAFALAMSLNAIVATLQYLGYNPLRLYPAGVIFHDRALAYSGEFLGTVGNSGLLSAF